ncbi:MAG: hypothetical protein K6F05_07790 [Succinivibrio sp.]|nr:hypothetical protein [Succinivibrio sp.]
MVSDEVKWQYDAFPVQGKKASYKDAARLFVHIYYDDDLKKQACAILTDNLCSVKERHNHREQLTPVEMQFVRDFMDDGTATINMTRQHERLKSAGIRVLISDSVKCPLQAHQAYDDRNMVEYAFNTLKSRLKCNRIRCHNKKSLRGKIFVQVLACSLAIMVRNHIAAYNASHPAPNQRFNLIYDSDHKVLAKLNNLMVTRFKDGWYFAEVVGYKKELFKALGVSMPTAAADNEDPAEDSSEDEDDKGLTSLLRETL